MGTRSKSCDVLEQQRNGMKLLQADKQSIAFTLIELLVVIAVLAVFAAMIIRPLPGSRKSPHSACLNNLKQIGVGIAIYSSDNNGLLPWQRFQIPSDTNSARVIAAPSMAAWRYPVRLARYMGAPSGAGLTRQFRCPLDVDRKTDGMNKALAGNEALSYFIGFHEASDLPEVIAMGDRNLSPGKGQPFYSSRRVGPVNVDAATTVWEVTQKNKFHGNAGCLLFTDGHAELVSDLPVVLTGAVKAGGTNANRFLFPQ
jgi:prepilin-type N-terminal cleavage/methylation domain-containing protein